MNTISSFRTKQSDLQKQVTMFLPTRLHLAGKQFAQERKISERELYRRLLGQALTQIADGADPLSPEPERAA